MTYRLDPQIDERLVRLIEALPVTGRAPASSELAARVRERRAGTVIRVVFVAALAAFALPATIWLGHAGPLPSSAALHCADVDPFRCHDSAARAAGAMRSARGGGLTPLLRQLNSADIVITEMDVLKTVPQSACAKELPCPPAVANRLHQIGSIDLVTVHFEFDASRGAALGTVHVWVIHFTDGTSGTIVLGG
jgi:hypothetical protein